MGNNLTLHAEGTPVCSFENSAKTPIESLKVYFAPTQSGNGDPSPSNVREIQGWTGLNVSKCGKNLFDGTIINRRIVDGEWSSTNTWQSTDLIPVKSNTKYTMTLNGTAYIPYIYEFGVDQKYNGHYSTASSTITTYSTTCYIALVGLKSVDWEYLCIEETDQTLPYSFSGETIPITFPVLGKNKFDKSQSVEGRIMKANGTDYTAESGYYISPFIPVIVGVSYTKNSPVVDAYHRFATYSSDDVNSFIRVLDTSNTITIESGENYIRFCGEITEIDTAQLELGDTATTYEPYNPNNTVYGGYVDLVKGEVVMTHYYEGLTQTIESLSYDYMTDNNVFFRCQTAYPFALTNGATSGASGDVKDLMCESLKPVLDTIWVNMDRNVNMITRRYNHVQRVCMIMPKSTFNITSGDTLEDMNDKINAYLSDNPIYISYQMQSSITYPIAPTALSALRSQNHIWSSAAEKVECDYALHETRAISDAKKRIAANEPHIETVSSSIATFNTDMRAPIKSCKVYFTPVQAGSGDPSTTNIRNISGWSGVEVANTVHSALIPSNIEWVDGYVTTAGSIASPDAIRKELSSQLFQVEPGVTYQFSYELSSTPSDSYWAAIAWYKENGYTIISRIAPGTQRQKYDVTATAPDDVKYARITLRSYGLLKKFSFAETPRADFPIDWSSTAGTAYGGYVDLITGELVLDRYLYTFDGTEDWTYQWGTSSANGVIRLNHLSDYGIPANHAISSAYNMISFGKIATVTSGNTTYGCYLNKDSDYFNYRDADYAELGERTSNEVKAAWKQQVADAYTNGTPYQICFTLLDDSIIHYQLTPTQLKTLVGTNNIWASNGSIEVSYWKH